MPGCHLILLLTFLQDLSFLVKNIFFYKAKVYVETSLIFWYFKKLQFGGFAFKEQFLLILLTT